MAEPVVQMRRGGDGGGAAARDSRNRQSVWRQQLLETRLQAYKEDLAAWLTDVTGMIVEVDSFMDDLHNGEVLCRLAQQIEEAEHPEDPARHAKLHFKAGAKPDSFQARDNVAQFLGWARTRINNTVLFETNCLVERKNEKQVLYCLMEISRTQYGVPPPQIVAMERQIDKAMKQAESGLPVETLHTLDGQDGVDEFILEIAELVGFDIELCSDRDALGRYYLGCDKPVFVRRIGKHVIVRVGDEWVGMEHYLNTIMPKMKAKEREQSIAHRLAEMERELAEAKNRLSQDQRTIEEEHRLRMESAKMLDETTRRLADERKRAAELLAERQARERELTVRLGQLEQEMERAVEGRTQETEAAVRQLRADLHHSQQAQDHLAADFEAKMAKLARERQDAEQRYMAELEMNRRSQELQAALSTEALRKEHELQLENRRLERRASELEDKLGLASREVVDAEGHMRRRLSDLEDELRINRRDMSQNRQLWDDELQRLTEENERLVDASLLRQDSASAELSMRDELSQLGDERRILETSVQDLQNQLDTEVSRSDKRYGTAVAQREEEKRLRLEAEARASSAQEQARLLKAELAGVQKALKRYQQQQDREARHQQGQSDEAAQLLRQLAALEKDNGELRKSLGFKSRALAQTRKQRPLQTAQTDALRDANTRLAADNDDLRRQVEALQEELKRAKAAIRRLEKRLGDLEYDRDGLVQDVSNRDGRIAALQDDLLRLRSAGALPNSSNGSVGGASPVRRSNRAPASVSFADDDADAGNGIAPRGVPATPPNGQSSPLKSPLSSGGYGRDRNGSGPLSSSPSPGRNNRTRRRDDDPSFDSVSLSDSRLNDSDPELSGLWRKPQVFTCRFCGRRFPSKMALRQHLYARVNGICYGHSPAASQKLLSELSRRASEHGSNLSLREGDSTARRGSSPRNLYDGTLDLYSTRYRILLADHA